MKCPHCLTDFHDLEDHNLIGRDKDGQWAVMTQNCPSCNRIIVRLGCGMMGSTANRAQFYPKTYDRLVYPKGSLRKPPPAEVPPKFSEDYVEACLVLQDSPKASSALSRRCLQHILREVAKVKPSDLFSEIQETLDSGKLPTDIAEAIDAVRNIGNFAAHPMKSKSTGEVVPVETGEAEWNLDVLEALFDFYFVRPAAMKKKKDALNAKLADAGKKPMQ